MPANDKEKFEFIESHLRVAAVSDILDSLGYKNQAMDQRIRPLLPDFRNCGFAGRARTFRWMETDYVVEDDPYGLEIDGMDALGPNDVVVHSVVSDTCAPWGELMATVAKYNGAVGCVCDGMSRDCAQLIEMRFPVYCLGVNPRDSKGRARVMDFDVPVKCGDVLVRPGDVIFADYDGVVVIPQQIADKVLELAKEKLNKESLTRKELQQGETLRNVWNKYHVL